MLTTALKNISSSYRFQFRAGGARLQRLSYTTAYWLCYFYAKYCGRARGDWAAAHLWAIRFLGRTGINRRNTRIRPAGKVELQTDLLTAYMIVKELYQDDMYEIGPTGEFSPAPGSVVFDIGAQQGAFTVLAALRADKVKVIAFEPEPSNFERLKNNITLNGLTAAVTAIQTAVSNKTGTAQLHRNKDDSGCHTLSPRGTGGDAVQVPVTTLDQMSSDLNAVPDLVKIDVEGHTVEVFEGGMGTIRRHLPDIVMEIENPEDAVKIESLLGPLNYHLRRKGNIAFARSPKRWARSRPLF